MNFSQHPNLKYAIASDHAGPELKKTLVNVLAEFGFKGVDHGTTGNESVDYPDYADKVAQTITDGDADFGVLICGSGIGMSIQANRYPNIRAALVFDAEMAALARQHNDANVLVLGARFVSEAVAVDCLKAFLSHAFEGGRHQTRVDKLQAHF